MTASLKLALLWSLETATPSRDENKFSMSRIRETLGIADPDDPEFIKTLPFSPEDITFGCENELQTAVQGDREAVDLPRQIQQSNYFANLVERVNCQDSPRRAVSGLENFLGFNSDNIWENSWVRIPQRCLNNVASSIVSDDLCRENGDHQSGPRKDYSRFVVKNENGEQFIRIPTSYLFKLSLAQLAGENTHSYVRDTAFRLMQSYTNDNCSPEVLSFYIMSYEASGARGKGVSDETGIRLLLSDLLLRYAGHALGLNDTGQKPSVYMAPHTPIRQTELANHVSDAFYRELYINPCLSGFKNGEEKARYMVHCHEVLSRSSLHAIKELQDAGIITRNLIVLPKNSTASLSNNGMHISIGSRRLSAAVQEPTSFFSSAQEKYVGDLFIKIIEHFLPLFVGIYSGAPHRLDFSDMHPESVLRYLPHQLAHRHLRMFWRAWKKKARIRFLQKPLTPVGPHWLDKLIATILQLRGDFVPDMRLLDYLLALPSTDRSPALDGVLGNDNRLKQDLADMGVFDANMSMYLPYKLRQVGIAGFSGFENRIFSQFADSDDLAEAVDIQALVTALASKLVYSETVTHAHIPDHRLVESERRQFFFASAAGIKSLYVKKDGGNRFLEQILKYTGRTRTSNRYRGYQKIYLSDYRQALLKYIEHEGKELIDIFGLQETVAKLHERLKNPKRASASGKLTQAILDSCNARSPFELSASQFNAEAERYYRDSLHRKILGQAMSAVHVAASAIENRAYTDQGLLDAIRRQIGEQSVVEYTKRAGNEALRDELDKEELERFINILLLIIRNYSASVEANASKNIWSKNAAPIY